MSLMNSSKAVQELFGINDVEYLRTKANSYMRNGVIPSSSIVKEGFNDSQMNKRGKKWLKSDAVNCLFNALILDAFFDDTKYVKEVFDSTTTRLDAAQLCEEILIRTQSSQGLNSLPAISREFLRELTDDNFSLRKTRLTSPFSDKRLPQMDISLRNTGLLYHILRSQRLAISFKEQLILCFLEQDLIGANACLSQLDDTQLKEDIVLQGFASFLERTHQEARSFNALLNMLPE